MKKVRTVFLSILLIISSLQISYGGSLPQNIRVGLFFGGTALTQTTISGSNLMLMDSGGNGLGAMDNMGINTDSYTVKPVNELLGGKYAGIYDNSGRLVYSYFDAAGIVIYPQTGNIMINSKSYRGGVAFKIDANSKLTVINVLPLEDYLYGVVPKEMPSSWGEEALKAQAVAARTYTIKNLNKFASQGFDICTTQNCQVYGGFTAENPKTSKAVDDTKGMVMYYNREPIQAVYHSSSGGSTEDAENIWSEAIPYLRGVSDPFSLGSAYDAWEYTISKSDLENKLKAAGRDIGSINGLTLERISSNGRVLKMTISGSKSSVSYQKESIRGLLGYSNMKSNWFTVEGMTPGNTVRSNSDYSLNGISKDLSYVLQNPNQDYSSAIVAGGNAVSSDGFVFRGKGYGHGLGLSQYGAKSMAEKGYTYTDILKYYFTGIEIY